MFRMLALLVNPILKRRRKTVLVIIRRRKAG